MAPSDRTVSRTTRLAAGNVVVVSAAEVAAKLSTLAWTLTAARLLTPRDFGTFFFVFTVALLLSSVVKWGFDPVLIHRGSAEPDRLPALYSQAVGWQVLLGVPVFAVAGGVLAWARPGWDMRATTAMLFGSVVLDTLSDTCRGASSARQRQGGTSGALVLQRLVTAALGVGLLVAGAGLVGLAAALFTGSAVGLAAHVAALRPLGVRLRTADMDRAGLSDFGRGTIVIGVSALVLMVLFRVDAVMLGVLRGDAEVGIYTAAYRLLETVLFVAFALRNAVFPVMSATGSAGRLGAAMQGGTAALAVVYVPFTAVLLAESGPVLNLLFGEPYGQASATALRWLAPAPLLFAIAYLGNSALQAAGRNSGMLAGAVTATVMNVGLNLALIPAYGAAGAGASSTISFAVQSAVVLGYLRVAGVRSRTVRAVAEPVVAGLAMFVVLVLLPWPLLPGLAAGGTVYALVWAGLIARSDPHQLAVARALVTRSRYFARGPVP